MYYVSKVPYVAQHPEVTVTLSHPQLAKPANYRDENNCEISYLDVKSEEPVFLAGKNNNKKGECECDV